MTKELSDLLARLQKLAAEMDGDDAVTISETVTQLTELTTQREKIERSLHRIERGVNLLAEHLPVEILVRALAASVNAEDRADDHGENETAS